MKLLDGASGTHYVPPTFNEDIALKTVLVLVLWPLSGRG
jgi:hypothetical protein